MQLVAGRTAQEYNRRKNRKGAFWEARYHVSIVDVEDYLHRCFVYIDLNMVRTGRVKHPLEWEDCGYYELFSGKQRYQVISIRETLDLLGYNSITAFRENYSLVLQEILKKNALAREPFWTENKIIGPETFKQDFLST